MDKVEFTFPDEEVKEDKVEIKAEEPEIEVVDDTPEQDRGRTPMVDPPKEMTDDELAKYDDGVRKRIQHFTKGYHEERRAKEAALREREEALRVAQSVVEENKRLKGTLAEGQTAYIEQAKVVAANKLQSAEQKYQDAYESGDAKALVEAQKALVSATLEAERINNFKPSALHSEETEVKQQPQQVQSPQVDQKLSNWQEKNSWFGPNRKMTAYALGYHQELVDNGINAGSDEYYERIDAEMRKRFPESFEQEKREDAPTPPKASNVVAPASRSTAPKKIVLTKTQVEIAKRLGVPLELYARKVAEEMRK